jgi:hypothetical protein
MRHSRFIAANCSQSSGLNSAIRRSSAVVRGMLIDIDPVQE